MASHNDNGLHITPLTMAVASLLWAVLFALIAWNLTTTVSLAKTMNNLPERVDKLEDRMLAVERKP